MFGLTLGDLFPILVVVSLIFALNTLITEFLQSVRNGGLRKRTKDIIKNIRETSDLIVVDEAPKKKKDLRCTVRKMVLELDTWVATLSKTQLSWLESTHNIFTRTATAHNEFIYQDTHIKIIYHFGMSRLKIWIDSEKQCVADIRYGVRNYDESITVYVDPDRVRNNVSEWSVVESRRFNVGRWINYLEQRLTETQALIDQEHEKSHTPVNDDHLFEGLINEETTEITQSEEYIEGTIDEYGNIRINKHHRGNPNNPS